MDNDFILKQFGEIEHKVENLIENCKAQAVANSELKNKIKSLEEEIQGKVEAEKVREIISEIAQLHFAYQEKQLGTAHAVLCALPFIPDHCDEVVILSGDVPLILPETITRLVEDHLACYRDISLLAVELKNPHGYGRVLRNDNGQIIGIIEEKDATAEQKKIKLINAGIYCINKKFLQDALPKIQSNNAQEELYLTDIMAIGHKEKKKMGLMVAADSLQILGVNDPQDLEEADKILKKRMRNIS